jgi:hypothetical protein
MERGKRTNSATTAVCHVATAYCPDKKKDKVLTEKRNKLRFETVHHVGAIRQTEGTFELCLKKIIYSLTIKLYYQQTGSLFISNYNS